MMIGGAALIVSNPQFQDTRQLQTIHRLGSLQEDVVVSGGGMAARGLGFALFGGGIFTGAASLWLSDGEPRSLQPETVTRSRLPDGREALLLPPEDEVMEELRRRVSTLIHSYPWLKSVLRSFCVVLIGPSGSGKSTVANAIAVLRSILWGWPVDILDPHGDKNLHYGTWSAGHLYGSTALSAMPPAQQIVNAWERVSQPYEPFKDDKGQRRSIIVDEFTGWADGTEAPELMNLTQPVLGHCLRRARGFGTAPILLLHGDKKGTAGGEGLPSGLLSQLLKLAAVVEVQGEADEWGEVGWSGKARFKKAAVNYSDEALENITIPDLIYPGKLQKELGEILEYLGIGLDDDPLHERVMSPELRRIDEALKQRFDSPEFTETLEAIYNGPSAPPFDDSENIYPEPQWSHIRQNQDAIALLSYLKRNDHRETDVNALKSNWGKRQNLTSREAIRSLLIELNTAHIGEWLDDATNGWRVLPEWGDFPEWVSD
jgi:hypothetical protein